MDWSEYKLQPSPDSPDEIPSSYLEEESHNIGIPSDEEEYILGDKETYTEGVAGIGRLPASPKVSSNKEKQLGRVDSVLGTICPKMWEFTFKARMSFRFKIINTYTKTSYSGASGKSTPLVGKVNRVRNYNRAFSS